MKEKIIYECSECGYLSPKWMGKCPNCGEWNTLSEKKEIKGQKKAALRDKPVLSRLAQIENREDARICTGISEFDRVLGGGMVRDSVTILTSPPGGGKSTLALMAACETAKQGFRVLYASGEESETQIKSRADRILGIIEENIWILADTSMDAVLAAIEEIQADLIILDSIQTFALAEYYPARAGNPTQTMECASALVQCAKNKKTPRAVLMIGQMNKNDEIAGLRALEHLVDTVLVMEGEGADELRGLTATKNRFGSTGEMGFFSMTEKGLVSIDNPSLYFITKRSREQAVSGSALTVLREGSRAVVAEVESLVSRSFSPYPSRISESMKRETLHTLLSILEQRGGIQLHDKDVVVKTTGGLRLKEQAANLAVLMSILSSAKEKPLPPDWAFIADVGLTGELKKVPGLESRIRELDRMGYSCVVTAQNVAPSVEYAHIRVAECRTLSEVIRLIFPGKR
ncbi:DNA repair protein RadA [Anaerotignum lactatifermentans]|uniref:DNA repair protein RadA n=1 Tax=Anaerotignum lactatifermentans TaxID=160404 RepID=A0ABS2GAS4_9FIRM|nr:DNA repair protein RadA [Anaerotignum lactatifermentans]MBM6828378.1 DNA repair protein RadA [Anaerotignum lactatifermentans]MBM6877658.1 DNA repair protein RadA [Anaerotignum lactatifermentans]MBM6949961.1 DNA repair protein RadA [Anaerotignum lactatifermentans]